MKLSKAKLAQIEKRDEQLFKIRDLIEPVCKKAGAELKGISILKTGGITAKLYGGVEITLYDTGRFKFEVRDLASDMYDTLKEAGELR